MKSVFTPPPLFAVEHRMQYRFDRQVNLKPHLIRLCPAPHCSAPVRAYSLTVSTQRSDQSPAGHCVNWLRDSFGNHLAVLSFEEAVTGFAVGIELQLEIALARACEPRIARSARRYPFEYDSLLLPALMPYLGIAESGPLLRGWLQRTDCRHRSILDFLAALGGRVQREIDYCVRMQPGVQSCEQTLLLGSGSCRDSAWLLVQILRHLGLAARFVSGYLLQPRGNVLAAEDSIELHAWVEVYIPGAGWLGIDSTSGLFTAAGHIPLACAPDPLATAPVSGKVGRCSIMLEFHTAVSRIN